MSEAELSVVVVPADGGQGLVRCLDALVQQVDAPEFDVVVPYDDTIPQVGALSARFPAFRFLDMGSIKMAGSSRNAFAQHIRIDVRRSAGLGAAQGSLIGLLEERGRPEPDWARTMVTLHRDLPCGAIGGAVVNGDDGALERAVYYCDFGRFQPPLEESDPEFLSDVNTCYKREALESVRHLWELRYQEAAVHWELRRLGFKLCQTDKAIVTHRRGRVTLVSILSERIHWGRTFALLRGAGSTSARCLIWGVGTPLLPTLLILRHFRRQLHKRRDVGLFIRTIPVTALVLHFWALGEFLGYFQVFFALKKKLQ